MSVYYNQLPISVRASLERSNENEVSMFDQEYSDKRRSVAVAYLASLFMLHYAYCGRVGMTLLCWLVGFMTLGVGGLIWWLIDLFRIPGIVRKRNHDIATGVLRDQRIIMGARQ